ERNRLLMLLRCAPAGVAARQLARFAALTVLLPWRRDRPRAPNFTAALRLRVLAEVALRLPASLAARYRIGRRATVDRRVLWTTWAGRD
ncbi:MAG: glycosyltransferase family 2 protein, partial [Pseudonocardiaceae bacterium]